MHLTSTFGLIICFSLIFSNQTVHGTIITTQSSQSSVYIAPGLNFNQSFNINGLLTEDLYTPPYDITSASVTFTFSDEDDPYSYYNSTDVGGTYREITNYYREETENVEVTTSTGQTTSYANTSPITHERQYTGGLRYITAERYRTEYYEVKVSDIGCGFLWLQPCYDKKSREVLEYRYYRYESYYDENLNDPDQFSFTWQLNTTSLADLISDGIIDYEISSTLGDFNFSSASLSFDIHQKLTVVPEPTTMILFGTGIAGLAAVGRRRRK